LEENSIDVKMNLNLGCQTRKTKEENRSC